VRTKQLTAPEPDDRREELRRLMRAALGREPEKHVIDSLPIENVEYLLGYYGGGGPRFVY
jgi:hypothetical protein